MANNTVLMVLATKLEKNVSLLLVSQSNLHPQMISCNIQKFIMMEV